MADKTLTVNGQPFTFNRDRFAGVRTMTSGHVYPADPISETNESHFSIAKTDDRNFRVVSNLTADGVGDVNAGKRFIFIKTKETGLRVGNHRVTFDVTLNGSTVASDISGMMLRLSKTDTFAALQPTVGSNTFDIEITDDGVPDDPKMYFAFHTYSSYDISISNLKLTQNYEEITVDRTADSGGRTMTVSEALGVSTTQIQVTVAGHSDISGIYTLNGTGSFPKTWTQQGGNGTIEYNLTGTDAFRWILYDVTDGNPFEIWAGGLRSEPAPRPWNASASLPSSITITPVPETLTVDRSSDRKGESRPLLSKVVGGAAAAYSLRDLNDKAGNNKVVRVRRASDNHERDFLAKEVSNGTLKNWVNTQTVLPLDIKAETADGRTGSVIPAAAAYSLRNLSSSYSGNVVEVRKDQSSTTEDTKSFTADEVSDGTLVDFVLGNTKSLLNSRAYFDGSNDNVKLTSEINLTGDFSLEYSFVVTEATQQIIGKEVGGSYIRAQGTNGIHLFRIQTDGSAINLTLTSTLKYSEANTIKLKRVSGKFGIYNESDVLISNESTLSDTFTVSSFGRARGGFAKGVIYNIRIDTNNDGTINHSYNGYGNTLSDWTDLVGSNNATAVNGSPALFTGQDQDGFVKTWYDQSGNSNHAVQATAAKQPKIVSAGTLLNELDFDGTDDILETSESSTFSQPVSLFHVFNSSASVTSDYQLNAGGSSMLSGGGGAIYYFAGSLLNSTIDFPTSGDTVHSVLFNGASSTVHADGTSVASGNIGSGTFSKTFGIGGRTNNSQFSNMSFKEIIIYDSDQTDNRTAIEANIGEAYSITGIPAYDNTVDGFVETWYDQSGNGNDAVQVTSTEQPLIVESGQVKYHLLFDGTNSHLNLTNALDFDDGSGFFVVKGTTPENQQTLLGGYSGSNYLPVLQNSSTVAPYTTSMTVGSDFVNGVAQSWADRDDAYDAIVTNNYVLASFIDIDNSPSATLKDIGRGAGGTVWVWKGEMKEIILYDTDQSDNRTAIEANIGEAYSITGIPAYDNTVDGFVETWYDQSGNGNDATQATAGSQPKIVENGNLLTSGILIGSGQHLISTLASTSFALNDVSSFVLGQASGGSGVGGLTLVSGASTFSNPYRFGATQGFRYANEGVSSQPRNSTVQLFTLIGSSTIATGFANGTSYRTISASSSTLSNPLFKIGSLAGNLITGSVKEIIIYNSDQSANRPAIEANINNQYDIY